MFPTFADFIVGIFFELYIVLSTRTMSIQSVADSRRQYVLIWSVGDRQIVRGQTVLLTDAEMQSVNWKITLIETNWKYSGLIRLFRFAFECQILRKFSEKVINGTLELGTSIDNFKHKTVMELQEPISLLNVAKILMPKALSRF